MNRGRRVMSERAAVANSLAGLAAVLLLLLSALSPAAAFGERSGSCFEQAEGKINLGSRIGVITASGEQVSGRLEFIDIREKLITITQSDSTSSEDRTFQLNEIASLQYRSTNSHPAFMWGGAATGIVFVLAAESLGSPRSLAEVGVSSLLGGVAGFVLGTILPSVSTSDHTIVCEPDVVREGP